MNEAQNTSYDFDLIASFQTLWWINNTKFCQWKETLVLTLDSKIWFLPSLWGLLSSVVIIWLVFAAHVSAFKLGRSVIYHLHIKALLL